MKKKFLSIIVCFILAIPMLIGCSNGNTKETAKENESIKKYGLDMSEIIVATSSGYEPFIFDKDGQLQGYDVDIWKEFEKRTGIKVKWERADFSGLLGLLQSQKADVVAAQLTPTPEREKSFAFTNPETYYGSVVVVPSDNSEIKGVKDLKGKKVGVGAGNEMHQKVDAMYSKGDVKFEVYTSSTLENMLKDLEYKRIDAILAQDIQAYLAIKNSGAKLKVLNPPFESSMGCLAVNKNNTKLLKGLNEFLDDIKNDGTLTEISKKWIGHDISVEGK
ncbi:substrate-binding periplasmic protein [Clostridium sp.]|uniref:substrate-binding periplasmic protein n=1 Tax=Clostridium sp. TaxID=1506 RepID=UPI002FC6469C